MSNNSQQATLDISARITGYLQSLKLLQQGIDQLDPGSKLKKSLVAAFKGAEDYLKKLSKTPIVDVSSDAKIHKLEQSFLQMNRLVHNVSDGFKSLTMDDISTEALNEELTETTNRIDRLTTRMNLLADSRHLNTLGTRVEGLRQLFSNLGANIDELGAIRGIQVLDLRIEQSTQRIQTLRELAEETRRAIDSWTTVESSGIWGRAAFNDRMTVHRMLRNGQGMQNVRDVDFNQEGFSQESLNRFTDQIRSNFLTYTQRQPEIFQQISQQFNEALNQTFTLDLNPTTLKPAIQSFIQRVQNILRDSSADLTIFGTGKAGFETAILGENINLNQFSAQWTTALERITAQANAAVEPLTRLVNIMQRWDSIDPTQVARVFLLMDLGQFQQARNLLEEIYELEHRAMQLANAPKRQNQERLRLLNQQRREALAELQLLQDARTTIQEDPAIQQMQQDYENLRNEVVQLRAELENLRSTKVNGVQVLAENAAEAADKVNLTKQLVKQLLNQLANSKAAKLLVGKALGLLKRWFSIYAAINMVSRAIKSMISTVQLLDKSITNIAIVTDMNQSDLWAQMPLYTKTAREFAASISGVYEVSQLYYQQGLLTVDVMKLTELTLKMARISGLDYSKSTDYMTNALRSFKMEMQDATTIVDVYSAVAASSATNVSLLAQAMSKTASSAQAVGSSFENTTAMMAVMILATRLAPENIGSAMKSIISRYGLLKTNPATLVDAEGLALSLNKVDTALQSVGISIHNAQGLFREFDDVIMDLALIWDTVDVNTQRYIATIMAGNRQQSRFLALVSSGERLKELSTTAMESLNAAQLQFLKTLDSVEAKQQQLQTSLQSLYTSSGIELLYKGILDYGAQIIKVFTNIPTIGKLPIPAIMKLGTTFIAVSKLVTTAFNAAVMEFQAKINLYEELITAKKKTEAAKRILIQKQEKNEGIAAAREAYLEAKAQLREITENYKQEVNKRKSLGTGMTAKEKGGMIATGIGIAAQLGAGFIANLQASGIVSGVGTVATGIGSILTGGIIGKIIGAISLVTGAIELFGAIIVTTEEKIENYNNAIEEANNKKLTADDLFKTLTDYGKKYELLKKHQDESNEAKEEFIALNAEIANKYPELIDHIDELGNLIVDLTDAYNNLAESKRKAAETTGVDAGKAQIKAAQDIDWILSQYNINLNVDSFTNSFRRNQTLALYLLNRPSNLNELLKYQFGLSALNLNENTNQITLNLNIVKQLNEWFNQTEFGKNQIAYNSNYSRFSTNMDNLNYLLGLRQIVQDLFSDSSLLGMQLLSDYFKTINNTTVNSVKQESAQIQQLQQKRIDGIVKQQISGLRKTMDMFYDVTELTTGFTGAYLNDQLLELYNKFIQAIKSGNNETWDKNEWNIDTDFSQLQSWLNEGNYSELYGAWAKNFNERYSVFYNNIFDEKGKKNIFFTTLDDWYNKLESITNKLFSELKQLYGNSLGWKTFENKFNEVKKEAADNLAIALHNIENLSEQAILSYSKFFENNYTVSEIQSLIKIVPKLNNSNQLNSLTLLTQNATNLQRQLFFNILQNNAIDTITGIEAALDAYAQSSGILRGSADWNNDEFVKLLQGFELTVKVNFNTLYQTLTESYTKNLKELDKALKNASSGMGFEDAVAMAQKLGKPLKEFRRVGEKWYYDNIQDIVDVYMPGNTALEAALKTARDSFKTDVLDKEGSLLKYAKDYLSDEELSEAQLVKDQYLKYHIVAKAFLEWQNSRKDGEDKTWDAYIKLLEQDFKTLDEAKQDLVISNWLSVGNIDEFLKAVGASSEDKSNLYQKALAGQLEGDLAKYQKLIIEYYQKGISAVYTAAENALNGKGATAIEVTEANASILSTLLGEDIKYNPGKQQTKVISADAINEHWDNFKLYFEENIDNFTVLLLEAYEKIFAAKYKNNTFTNITSAISSYKGFDATVYAKLPETIRNLATWDEKLQKYVLNLDLLAGLSDIQLLGLGLTADQVRLIRAQIEKAAKAESNDTIIQNITKNHKSLNELNVNQISKLLNIGYEATKKYLIDNGDGTWSIDLNTLQTLIKVGGIEINGATQTFIENTVLSEIELATKYINSMSTGYTNSADMQKIMGIINEGKQLGDEGYLNFDAIFEYNTALHAWKLSSDGMNAYLEKINKQISNATSEQLRKGLIDQKLKTLLDNNDLDTFLKLSGAVYEPYRNYLKGLILSGNWDALPEEYKTWIDEFMEMRRDTLTLIINGLNNAASSFSKQAIIKKDQVDSSVMDVYAEKYGGITKTQDGDYLIDLALTTLLLASKIVYDICISQGKTIEEASDQARQYIESNVHNSSKSALNTLKQLASNASGMDKATADSLQDYYKNYGGQGQLTEWNDTLQSYVFVGEALKQFIDILSTGQNDNAEVFSIFENINKALISSNQIDTFLGNIGSNRELLTAFINKGTLSDSLKPYYEALTQWLGDGTTNVVNEAIALIKGEKKSTSIKVTPANKAMLLKLSGITDLDDGQDIIIDQVNSITGLIKAINDDETKTVQQKQKEIADVWTAYYSVQAQNYDAIKAIISSPDNFDITAWQKLPESFQKLATFNRKTGKFSMDITRITNEMLTDPNTGLSQKEVNEFKAKIAEAKRQKSATTIITEAVNNYNKLSETNIQALADLLKKDYDEVIKYLDLKKNSDGTYQLDLTTIRQLVEENDLELNTTIQLSIANMIQSAIESARAVLQGQTEGFSNYADMQKIVSRVQLAGFDYNFDDLFEWDNTLHTYVTTTKGLFAQLALAQQQLEGATDEERAVAQSLINDLLRQFLLKIDFTPFLSATSQTDIDSKTLLNIQKAINDYNEYRIATGQEVVDFVTDINKILLGGTEGVKAAIDLASITGKTLSKQEIDEIYRKRATALVTASSEITAKVGTIVGDLAAAIIQATGGAITQLADGSNIVTKSATELVSAYRAIYINLSASGIATLEELNNIVAKEFEAADKADLTGMMSGLTDMTYSTLANIFTAAGLKLTPTLINNLLKNGSITSLGAGKIRVNDFEQFAKAMGVDPKSLEYYKAFSAFNDLMININKQTATNIKNAASGVLSARTGDQINLTELSTHLTKGALTALTTKLEAAGATLNKGILTIDNTSNIEGIYQAIIEIGVQAGKLVEEDLVEARKLLFKRSRLKNLDSVLQNIASNALQLTEDNVEQLAKALGIGFEEALSYFYQGDNGYFKIDEESLRRAIEGKNISKLTDQAIANMMSAKITAAEGVLNSLAGNISNGFTNFSEVRSLVSELNQYSANDIDINEVATYDDTLNKWVLNTQGIIYEMQMVEARLKQSGLTTMQAKQELMSMRQQLADSIDIMSYVSASDKDVALTTLTQSIDAFNAASQVIGYTTGINVDLLTEALNEGGMKAVAALAAFTLETKQKFTSEDYWQVFQVGINKINTAVSEINTEVGGIVSKETAEILGLENFTEIENTGKYLVTSTTDLVHAYLTLIEKMANETGITLSQLNDAIVEKYNAELSSLQLISQISNGALDMSSFKETVTKLGYRVDDMLKAMTEAGIAELDKQTGNIKILNFDSFIGVLGISKWDDNGQITDAYKTAYKSWNDSLIENLTKDANNIKSLLDSLASAKAGDYINISSIWNKIDSGRQELVANALEAAGALINNGIIFITEEAQKNIVSITRGLAAESGVYNTKKGNLLMASAYKQLRETSIDSLYLNILQSRESLNEDNIRAIADAFGYTYDSVAGWLEATKQGDGTYKLSVADVEALFKGRELKEETLEYAKKLLGSINDDIISSLSGISNKTFSLLLMSTLVSDLKTKTGKEYNQDDLFKFNEELGGYVLTTQGIYTKFRVAALEIGDNKEGQKLLELQAEAFLSDINLTDVVSKLQGNLHDRQDTKSKVTAAIQKYNAAMTALGKPGLNPTVLLDNLAKGGIEAVQAAQAIAKAQGQQLSDADAKSIYRSRVDQLMQAAEELMSTSIGGVISDTTADLLGYKSFASQRLTLGGSAVLRSAADLILAYKNLYSQLEESGAATLSELNQIMARELGAEFEAANGSNKGAEYLSKAASMTYEDLGLMFAQAGVSLAEHFSELVELGIISEIGGGLIRVENFAAIAQRLGIEQNSLEYTKAFKAYNDSLIQLDTTVKDNILAEVKSVANAKSGKASKINLTQLYMLLDEDVRLALQSRLMLYGGYLKNGILNIQANANIPGLIQRLTSFAKEHNLLLEDEIAELADTLSEIIQGFANSISKGLSGTLNNSEANNLKAQAKNWFDIDINFMQTNKGLQMSVDKATELYFKLKQVDSVAANLVFESLSSSLTKTNDTLSTASSITAKIRDIEKQLGNPINANNKELQNRLKLYKEIQVAQMDSAESYDFMGQSLPAGMQGVENYWNSWGKAFKTLNQAAENATKELKLGETRSDSTIAIQDFYNMVNLMNNLAAMSGEIEFLGMKLDGSMESAAALIEKGMSYITDIDGEGAVVNLSKWGVSFANGAEGMAKGVDKGIKEMAQSQIDMLDGLIQFLETVVAMEDLKDLDTDKSGTFEFGLIFTQIGDMFKGTDKAAADAKKVLDRANSEGYEDLLNGLKNTKVNNTSLYQMLTDLQNGVELTKLNALLYTAALSALYQQLETGNYDQEALGKSILEIAKNSKLMLSLDLGGQKVLVGRGVQFTWDKDKQEWVDLDGLSLGSDEKLAYLKHQAKVNKKVFNALMEGGTVEDTTLTLTNGQKISVQGGVTLAQSKSGFYYANGKYFNTPEKAAALLQKGVVWNVEKDLANMETWLEDGIEYMSVQGRIWQKVEGVWVDTKGREYDTPEQAVKAAEFEAKTAWTGLDFDQFNFDENGNASGFIKFGVGINVTVDQDGVHYLVDGKPYTNQKLAKEEARRLAIERLENATNADANPGEFEELMFKYGFVTELDPNKNNGNRYLYKGKQFSSSVELFKFIREDLFKDGKFQGLKLYQELPVLSKLIVDKAQAKLAYEKMSTEQATELQKAFATGKKSEITKALGVKIEWKSDDKENASIEELQQLAEILGIKYDTTLFQLDVGDELTKQIFDILTGEKIEKTIVVTAIPADDPASKAYFEENYGSSSSIQNKTGGPEGQTLHTNTPTAQNGAQAVLGLTTDIDIPSDDALEIKNQIKQRQQQQLQEALLATALASLALQLAADQLAQAAAATQVLAAAKTVVLTIHTLGAGPHEQGLDEISEENTEVVDENTQKLQELQSLIDLLQQANQLLVTINTLQDERIQQLSDQLTTLQGKIEELTAALADKKNATSGLSTLTSAEQELIWPTQNNSFLSREELQNVLSQKYAEALSQIGDSELLSGIVSVLENELATMYLLSVAIQELLKFFNNNNLNKGEYPTGDWNTSEVGFNNELNDNDLSLAGQALLLISKFKLSENTEIAELATILEDNLEKFYLSQDENREELNLAISNLITSLTEAGIAVPEYQLLSDSEGSNALISGLDAFKEALSTVNESSTLAATQAGALTEAQQMLTTTTINTDSEIHGVIPTISAFGDKTRNLSAPLEDASLGASRFARSLNQIPTNKSINVEMILTAKDADLQPVDITSLSITGTTAAKGTLMGLLGPELVVSNGRYFVVGQNGALMVNLASDAIVFNHLQTKSLLKNNKISSRGKPVTNERNAISFAKGTGPAKASAREALATLKSIRAMWKAMLTASMKDLGSMAGREIGSSANKSSGGSGNNGDNEIRTTTAEIQRWYNLLRQIESLERDITYQNTLQNKLQSDRIANGQALYKSYKQLLLYLDGVISRNQQLADLQKSWYERKRNELAASDYGKIFTYDENGMLQYQDGRNMGLDILLKLTARDIYGQPTGAAATAQSQIAYLQSIGFDTLHLKYNSDGTIIDASDLKYSEDPNQMYLDMMNNFWDNLDGWRDELDGLYDSYREQLNAVLLNEAKRNEILQKIVDNQLSVLQDILKAIESREQKIIDELQKLRDALEKSSKQFIDGLSDQLKELKEMYQNQENEKLLTKLRRQVAILERSGGSASQIRSLQDQIAAKEQNLYFTEREQQIAAIQKASDLEIARLDSQISIMTLTLKYQKLNGLLWLEVYQVMASTPLQIRQFIILNTPDFQSASALDVALKIRDIDLRINEWVGYRDDETAPSMSDYYYDWDSYFGARSSIYGNVSDEDILQQARDAFDAALQDTGDINAAGAAADAVLAAVWDFARPGAGMASSGTTGTGGTTGIGGGSSTGGTISTSTSAVSDLLSSLTRPAGISDAQWQAVLDAIGRMGGRISNLDLADFSTALGKTAEGLSASELRALQKAAEEAAAAVGPSNKLRNQDRPSDKSDGPALQKAEDNLDKISETIDQVNDIIDKKQRSILYKYKNGGLIDYTGPAWVDGSPTKPLGILTALQTLTLRNFMTNGVDTLSSILSQIWQNMHHSSYITDTLNQEENTGVSILHLDVNVNVEQIANDYDVRAIGNTVMDEILKIARKSGTRGLNRR